MANEANLSAVEAKKAITEGRIDSIKKDRAENFYWYVAHTYSGYENKIKKSLENYIQNNPASRNLYEEILIPMEDVVEEKKGEQVTVSRKKFPGYIFIKMKMTNDTWFRVRNTNGVTGFVGSDAKMPDPLTPEEIISMGLSSTKFMIAVAPGDTVQLTAGGFEGNVGTVSEINNDKGTVTVMVSVFGRETPVEVSFEQIKKV